MQIEIPDELYEEFIRFLDVAQASFTEEEVKNLTENEQKLIIWLDNLLGEKKAKRFKTQDAFMANITAQFKKQIDIPDGKDTPEDNADETT